MLAAYIRDPEAAVAAAAESASLTTLAEILAAVICRARDRDQRRDDALGLEAGFVTTHAAAMRLQQPCNAHV